MATWEETSNLLDVILGKLERVKALQADIGQDMEALREKVSGLTQDAADLAVRSANDEDFLSEKLCAVCGHSESRHNTAGGFCKHCPCIEFVDHTTSANPLI